ncbi:MAG: hypothetical protein RL220_344 [Bacteroidota bacterium]
MQETEFIRQNKDKWSEFEETLKDKDKDPVRLTHLFIETTDDLSYSRTHYANRSVRVYLNGIAQQVFQIIYKNRTKATRKKRSFWREELPDAMWHARKSLLLSFSLFIFGMFIGIFSSMYYPDFAKIMLGSYYIEMTESNIANGDPMAVYKDDEPVSMFLRIAWNNVYISFLAFTLGIVFGVGTVFIILRNAIMFGAFIYFFIERDLFAESFLAIMLHGTLELSMIVLSGCAGFALSRGLIFPGTYTRGQALIFSARNGIKIMIGVAVLLTYAAIIESFATRFTDLPEIANGKLIIDVLRGLVIAISFILVFGYFVFYPWYRHRKGLVAPETFEEKASAGGLLIDLKEIKSSGRLFTESFIIFGRTIGKNLKYSFLAAILASTALMVIKLLSENETNVDHWDPGFYYRFWNFSVLSKVVHLSDFGQFLIILILMIGSLLMSARWIRPFVEKGKTYKLTPAVIATSIVVSTILCLNLTLSEMAIATSVFVFPFCLIWYFISYYENVNPVKALIRTFTLLRNGYWKTVGLYISITAMHWIFVLILQADLTGLLGEFIQMNVPRSWALASYVPESFDILLSYMFLCVMFPVTVFSSGLAYFTLVEMNEAPSLKEAIRRIGIRKRAYGIERE